MKKLSIARSNLEILRVDLHSPQVLIGRAPTCDYVLRAPGVAVIHFLLEWIGEGQFNSEKGFWTLYDVSASAASGSVVNSTAGEGVILTDQPIVIGGFKVGFIQDRLSETHLAYGTLGDAFMDAYKTPAFNAAGGMVLEIVRFKKEDGSLIDVIHQNKSNKNLQRVIRTKELQVKWSAASQLELLVDTGDLKQVTSIKTNTTASNPERIMITTGDVLKLEFAKFDLYARLVPHVFAIAPKKALLSDRFFIFSLMGFILLVVGLFYLRQHPLPNLSLETSVTPRVVTLKEEPRPAPVIIEKKVIVSEPVKLQLTAGPEINVHPKLAPKKEKPVAIKKVSPTPQVKKNPVAKIASPIVQSKVIAPPKAPAPPTDVATVGLLGKLKSSKVSTAEDAQIQAEALTTALKEDQPNAGQRPMVISTMKSGLGKLPTQEIPSAGPSSLTEASTNLTITKVSANGKLIPMSDLTITRGSLTLGDGVENPDNPSVQKVEGGLTRDQVKTAIASQRSKLRDCFERNLSVVAGTGGTIIYSWSVSEDGQVTQLQMLSSELKNSAVESCVSQAIQRTKFPKSKSNQSTEVVYPFRFQK